jgi:putative peptide zinc metalloprotease protein
MCGHDDATTAHQAGRTVGAPARQETHVLEGANGRMVRLPATAHFVLTSIDGGASPDDVARQLSARLGRDLTAGDVTKAYALVREQVDAIAQRPRPAKPFGLWFRVRFLPLAVVGRVSRVLSRAFHPVAAIPLVLVAAATAIHTLAVGVSGHTSMMGASFLPMAGLFMVSMVAHEFGHASASARYGVPARDIGFGLYLIYPVFYNDVTSAWRLPRRQRVVIDLAGTFFQFLVGAVYVLVGRVTGWTVFELAAVTVFSLGGLYILLPIFKFDGYWLWTDLLGVHNLSRQVRRVARHVGDRLRRRPTAPLPWPRWASLGVLCYGAFTALFLLVFVLRMVVTVPSLVADYPARIAGLARDLSAPPHAPATGRLSSVLGPTYVLLAITFASVRLGVRAVYAVRPAVAKRTRGFVGS